MRRCNEIGAITKIFIYVLFLTIFGVYLMNWIALFLIQWSVTIVTWNETNEHIKHEHNLYFLIHVENNIKILNKIFYFRSTFIYLLTSLQAIKSLHETSSTSFHNLIKKAGTVWFASNECMVCGIKITEREKQSQYLLK